MLMPPAHTAENVPLIAVAVWLDTLHWKFPQDEGLGARMLWDAQTPVRDDEDDALPPPGELDAPVPVLATLDGLVGSSEWAEFWKLHAARADVAAKAMSRRAKRFIEDPCEGSDYKSGLPPTNLRVATPEFRENARENKEHGM